jgi:plastocyanin
MRVQILSAFALGASLLAGCAGGSTPSTPAQTGSGPMPQTIAFDEHLRPDSTFTVGVKLEGESAGKSKAYGAVLGYFKSGAKKSAVVTIPLGSSVVFTNVDTALPHTGSLLGDASKKSAPWPSTFTGSGTQSAAGTDISATDFSTGTLSPGSSSLTYTANVPGFYMFGCAFHYVSHEMRDVIIVK